MRRFVRALVFAAVAAMAGGAQAVELPKSAPDMGPEGQWFSQCDIDRMTDAKTCRMVTYRAVDDGYVAVSIIPTGNDYHMFLTANGGMLQSCAIRVDRQPRIETYIATLNMCMFPNFLSGRILDQFRSGSSVLVRVNSAKTGRRDIDFSLNGFARNFEEMQKALQ
jgi:invasion protein IalB